MILLLGDIHGDYRVMQRAIDLAEQTGASAIIQVGDFCLFRGFGMNNEEQFKEVLSTSKIPVYFIDGNHDDCTRWIGYKEVSQVYPDIQFYYIPRGTVMELDGRTIAFMGGAASIDRHIRIKEHMHWDINELISLEEYTRMRDNSEGKQIDMFITHCPPDSVIQEHFDNSAKLHFGVGLDWEDPTQKQIEELWHAMGTPMIYSGHMHRRVVGQTYRILDINELLAV